MVISPQHFALCHTELGMCKENINSISCHLTIIFHSHSPRKGILKFISDFNTDRQRWRLERIYSANRQTRARTLHSVEVDRSAHSNAA